jgi:hypothetical protein
LFIRNRLNPLATPLNSNLTKYSTRRNSEGLLNFFPEPEKVYRRRLAKASYPRVHSHLGTESISDIHLLFVNKRFTSEMAIYDKCNFTAINNYPHALTKKAIEKLPSFQGNNVVSAKMHIKSFMSCTNKWCATHDYEDVKMKLFVLSLEEDALDWYEDMPDNTFKTLKELLDAFTEKWGEKKDHRQLLAAPNSIKKNENETMDEFNKKFNELVSSMHTDIKPLADAILIYYVEAFGGEMRYQLRDKEPLNLKATQDIVVKIDKNMQASGKSNLLGFSRGSSSRQIEAKGKAAAAASENKDPNFDLVLVEVALLGKQRRRARLQLQLPKIKTLISTP